MRRLTVHAGGVASPSGISGPVTIVLSDGRIEAIQDGHMPPRGGAVVEAAAHVVAPGLIDLHTHGAGGAQAIDGTVGALGAMSAAHASTGVTGFLASVGGKARKIEAGLSAVHAAAAADRPVAGARCLGAHLEGPFISPSQPGAFPPETIVAVDVEAFQRYVRLAGGTLRLVTLAPELPGAAELIRTAVACGVVCSAGHSSASAATMEDAITLGVSAVTHLFNAMPSLHHREPGIVGIALTDARLTVEVIADGVHLDPRTVRLVARAKPWQEIALVTDSIAASGLADGAFDFEEQAIVVRDGQARLGDGTLAGSTLGLDRAVRNFAAFAEVPWARALASATVVPARLLGLGGAKGVVAPGFDADLVAFDADRAVVWTMVGGDVVYRR